MDTLQELWSFTFMRHAVYAGLLASVLCGVVGTLVVVKRLVFVSGGISHAAFGGLGICYFLGLPPRTGAALVAVIAALALAGVGRDRLRTHDAAIGVLWAVGMAVGIVFIHQTPGYAPNLMTYLFGNILTVGRGDVWTALAFVAAVVTVMIACYKEVVAVAFDEAFAAVQGVPVRSVMALLMVLVALSVVLLIQLVGIILVIALLTIPPLISLRLVTGFAAVVTVATAVGMAITLGGLGLSYAYDLPSGPVIVLLGAAVMILVDLALRLRSRLTAGH